MTEHGLVSGNIRQESKIVDVNDVIVRERQREVDEKHVDAVVESFASLGGQLQLQPIILDGDFVLIDGAHRLAAVKKSGGTHINAMVFHGVTDEDRPLLEAEANRVRKQLSPLELEDAWSKYYEPAFKARAQRNQELGRSNLRSGADSPVIGDSYNREPATPVSIPRAAKETTGLSLDTLNRIGDIKATANSTTESPEIRAAAEKALEKLSKKGAAVETVHKSLMGMKERKQALVDPSEAQARQMEAKLDKTLSETSLLSEKLAGALGEDLRVAAQSEQVAQETLRAIRIALTQALASVVVIECSVGPQDANGALHRIGAEVTRMLSENAVAQLGMDRDDG